MLPLIVGCSSTRLNKRERACFEELSPAGFILFAHNIEEPSQVRDLCASLHAAACVGSPRVRTAILIDQEGGRVQRLRPPHWRGFPAARAFGEYWQGYGREAAIAACRASARLMGEELADLGISVDCAPVADLPSEEADPIIGDRAFASSIERIQDLARAQAEGLLDAGIVPVVKHAPGHGRATCDSHKALPRVEALRGDLAKSDFACFLALRDLPMMMTAHILYSDIDALAPATLSKKTIESVLRDEIGFEGLLLSDDLRMKALRGSPQELALKALEAGCDLPLFCGSGLRTIRAIARTLEEAFETNASSPAFAPASSSLSAKLDKVLDFAAQRKKTFSSNARQENERQENERQENERQENERQEAERLLAQVEAHHSAHNSAHNSAVV